MKLSQILNDEFTADIKVRGKDYFLRRKVTLKSQNEADVHFHVHGQLVYEVDIFNPRSLDDVSFKCTCLAFQNGDNCKHIWASLLFLDDGNLLTPRSDDRSLEQIPDDKKSDWRDQFFSAKIRLERNSRMRLPRRDFSVKKIPVKVGSYAVELSRSAQEGRIFLQAFVQERLKKGGLGIMKQAELNHDKIELYEEPAEKDFLWDLLGRTQKETEYGYGQSNERINSVYLSAGYADEILHKISVTGKLFLQRSSRYDTYSLYERAELLPYSYSRDIWKLCLKIEKAPSGYELSGFLSAGEGTHKALTEAIEVIENFIFFPDFFARSNASAHSIWFELMKQRPVWIAESDLDAFMEHFVANGGAKLSLDLPPEIRFAEKQGLTPITRISFAVDNASGNFEAKLNFIYDENEVSLESGHDIYNFERKEKIHRDLKYEADQYAKFLALKPRLSDDPAVQGYFSESDFVSTAEKCVGLGWQVQARGQAVKIGNSFEIQSQSGVDWFDIHVDFKFASNFGEQLLSLPQLLHSLRTGQRMVTLGDGSTGLLPEAWLSQFSSLLGIGSPTETGIRLSKIQALFYGASLTENEKFNADKKFSSLRTILYDINHLSPATPDKKFEGTLREYQKEGLSWLSILSEHQVGGILADDMGLGKTIQVLAMISKDKADRGQKAHQPSLVLAPKSLIFNWEDEAKKFTPNLKILKYVGGERHGRREDLSKVDMILTTYQTLRNDIELFKSIHFNFLILDEAHQIKNSNSQVNQAARLIQAEKKFALSGTPVENSLMDLFSILSVVTPGLVSENQAHKWVKENDPDKIKILGRALRPFLLRRTKEQVLKDLPEKSEQILYCELSVNERKKYDELKNYYWGHLSGKIAEKGLGKSKIEILEALLRLRQASCHLGLLSEKEKNTNSSKFEMVLEQIEILIQDGHKALIFSQFTSLLDLFGKELRRRNIRFEYLDGQTQNRSERVRHFQEDKNIPLFLLSLKAGGVGLNLTAADYVFILDPWWNPAAESQAIDRTHRIGQTQKVLAYKVIAKDTIEEKILQLQEKKKSIARAVVSEEVGLLKGLQMEDLKEFFS